MNDGGLQGHYAGFASRLAAYAIDAAVIAVVTIVAAWISVVLLGYLGIDVRECGALESTRPAAYWLCVGFGWVAVGAGAVFPSVYTLFFWSTTGQTPGKAVMGLRIVRLDGKRMNLWIALVRLVGYVIGFVTLGLGFLAILADDRRQGWHDKLAQTCVIYSWKAHGDADLLARLGPRS